GADAEQSAQLAEVAGDAVALAGQLRDFLTGFGLNLGRFRLGLVEQLLRVRLRLGDKLLGVALGRRNQRLGVLVSIAPTLGRTLLGGLLPGLGVGGARRGGADQLLGVGECLLVLLGDLAVGLLAFGDERELQLGRLLVRTRLSVVENLLGLRAHVGRLTLSRRAHLLDLTLG